ncbi:MAG: PhoPQ-activated protein PqaA family protein, partial [Planctomycetota bacterium]|nr:PhoPQ-activated protein PqaA family protein [Planctomycetota bacterium]
REIPQRYAGSVAIVSQAATMERRWSELAEIPPLLGFPSLLIESGNPGPRYGERSEGMVMQHGLDRFLETRDPRWIGYAQLGKVIVRSVTAAAALGKRKGFAIDRAVVTGSSKRGLAAWIACAADDRIVGAMPSGYLSGDVSAFLEHKLLRWGPGYAPFPESNGPASVTTAEQVGFTLSPGWDLYEKFTDPYLLQERLVGKKILNTIGTVDPLYPVTYGPEWQDAMEWASFQQLYASGYGHGHSSSQHLEAWAMWLAHCLGGRTLTTLKVQTQRQEDQLVITVRGASEQSLRKVTVCYAIDPNGTFLPENTTWIRKTMSKVATGTYRFTIPESRGKYILSYVEVRDRDENGVPGVVTSRLIETGP